MAENFVTVQQTPTVIKLRTIFAIIAGAPNQMGYVEYDGNLNGRKPVELSLDAVEKKLSVVFNDNSRFDVATLKEEQLQRFYDIYALEKGNVVMGFHKSSDLKKIGEEFQKNNDAELYQKRLLSLSDSLTVKPKYTLSSDMAA